MNLTQFQELSTLLTISEQLSSILSLSGLPIHPYDNVKLKYFDSDYKFPCIEDISIPTDFCPYTYMHELSCITKQDIATCLSAINTQNLSSQTAFEGTNLLDENSIKRNIEFSELVKTVTMDDIKTRPNETIQKLTSFYVKSYR